jgi:hypothetical protein
VSLLAALCIFNVVLSNSLQDGLFLQFHDKAQIPVAMLCGSLLTAGVTLAIGTLMRRRSPPHSLRWILFALAAATGASAAWNLRPGPASTFALFLVVELSTTLGTAATWSYFQAPLDSGGLRKVMPRLGAWAGVGGLCAGLVIPIALRKAPPQYLLPVSALVWLAAAFLVDPKHTPISKRARPRPQLRGTLFSLPLVRWMAVSAAGAAWLGLLIQFQNRVALQHTLKPAEIASFMAVLLAVSSITGIAVQAFVATPVLEKWGVGVALAILPIALTTLVGLYAWVPVLPFIAGGLFTDKTLRPNLARPGETCLIGALPPEARPQVALTLGGVIAPLLKALGALALCFAAAAPRIWLLSGALVIGVGLIALSLRWGRIYASALERTLAEGIVGAGEGEPLVPLIDGPRLSILLAAIDTGSTHARALALQLLQPHRTGVVRQAMLQRLDSPVEHIRIGALQWLQAQPSEELERTVRERFARKETSDAERIALLEATRAPAALLSGNLERWLGAMNLDLRRAVVRALYADANARPRAAEEVEALLAAPIAEERVAGLQLVRELFLATLLHTVRSLVGDEDPRVTREALATVAALDPGGAPAILLDAIDRPLLASAAMRGLAALGEPAVPETLRRLRWARHGSPLRLYLLRALGLLHAQQCLPPLLAELDGPEGLERLEAVKALRAIRRDLSEPFDAPELTAFHEKEVRVGLQIGRARERLRERFEPNGLLMRELAAQLGGAQERVSRALALRIGPQAARMCSSLRAPRSPHKDQARELLRQSLGAGPLFDSTLKLLDADSDWPANSAPFASDAGALQFLAAIEDRWIRSALRHDAKLTLTQPEDPMEAALDTILFLKDVSLFETLTNPQLVEVARLAEKTELQRGAPLFVSGAAVDYLYILRKGTLRVMKNKLEVARIGAGECVGEMAVLAGTERTADVEAVEACQLLRFDAEDFLALLETYTEIGRGLLRALVRRLAKTSSGEPTGLQRAQSANVG